MRMAFWYGANKLVMTFAAERKDDWNSDSGIDAAQFDIGKRLVSSIVASR